MGSASVVSPGDRLGHYELEELLGRGGMGEVFAARDLELGRRVALKILPQALASDPDRLRRFQREARALAALNHPNIVTVFSVEVAPVARSRSQTSGEPAGAPIDFMTMELVDGSALAGSIPRGGMEIERFFRLAVPLADALAAAHAAGIVHRDLKPGNIVVDSSGQPRILDFGLAKSLGPPIAADTGSTVATATASLETRTGAIVGTLGYMSPEQVKGEPVDERSDLFSLGLVLYEMATGQRPFRTDSAAEYLSAVLRDVPASLEELRPDLPRHLARIIRHCLEKDPERRFQSAKDLRNELEDLARELDTAAILESRPRVEVDPGQKPFWPLVVGAVALLLVAGFFAFRLVRRGFDGPGAPPTAKVESLAVLPFDNLMQDPDEDYFVEGMHEALITDLSKIGALRVISRTSAMRYAETEKSLPEIAAELDVDALVEGSVLRADGQVRITAQLIEGRTDRHLWAESYDRELENVLVLLSEVARAIAAEIEVAVTAEQGERLASAPAVRPEAQELYLRAQHYFNSGDFADFGKALELHRRVVEVDPTYARGWAALAGSYLVHGFFNLAPPEEMIPEALAAAERALALDHSEGVAHLVIGYVALFFDWDWETARRELELAIELAPTHTMAHHAYADYLFVMGDCEGSVDQVQRGRRHDPMGGWANGFVTAHLTLCGRYDEAIVEGQKSLELGIVGSPIEFFVGMAHWLQGEYDAALEYWRQSYGPDSEHLKTLESGYAEGGPRGAMLAAAERRAAASPARRNPYTVAVYYSMAGETEAAFDWLERAYVVRTPQLLHLTFDPRLDPIRSDPRFADLLLRIGIPESAAL